MTRSATLILLLLTGLLAPRAGAAEEPEPAFMRHLYPPDVVMRFAREIQLSTDQRRAITKAVRATQDEVLEIQWEVQDAMQGLEEAARQADEEALVATAEQVFRYEARIKLAHLRLLARIKRDLTPVQQKRLDGLREPPSEP